MTTAEFDALYSQRQESSALATCTTFLKQQLQTGVDYEWLWRAARLEYFLGLQHLNVNQDAEAKGRFQAGAQLALQAEGLEKGRIETAFWSAVCELEAARLSGTLAVARATKLAEKHLNQAAYLDESFHHGGPYRELGRIWQHRPLLLGGSLDRAMAFYKDALLQAPENSSSLLYLADAQIIDRQPTAARETLHRLIAATPDPDWQWEHARDVRTAQDWLTSRFG